MLRYEQSSGKKPSSSLDEGETDYFDFFEGSQGGSTQQANVDASFNSATSGISGFNHSASSSKAVLAALRALQDKIRRLETERAAALDEAAQLRSQLKSQEIESEHTKEKDILHNQKSLQEARLSYERVVTEKDDLEKSLQLLRSQNDQTQAHIHELRERNKELEDMRAAAEKRLGEVEGHLVKFQEEVDRSKHRESDLSNAMVWETKRHEEEMVMLKDQVASLNAEYGSSAKARAEKDAKLIELDHLVGQLLSVNETLICQISGKRISSVKAAAAAAVPKKPAKKKRKGSLVPRAASKGTASSRAKNEAGASKRAAMASGSLASRSLVEEQTSKKELLGMHEMYVNLANSITGKPIKTVTKVSSVGSGDKIKKSIGKSSTDTQMRRRIIDQGNAVEEGSVLTAGSGVTGEVNVNLEDFERKYMTPASGVNGTEQVTSSATTSAHVTSHIVPSPGMASPGLNQPELKTLIHSLEEEFESLNDQYQRILQSSNDKNKKSEDTSQELVSVIQRLHKKGEQLRALKSPTK
mmetsp:Transcript_9580/g.15922  ORF Transcript_9580/g.15922 Transcript_9580/m.15922 type:complete len:527 (+) Transcript_9580:72-1652(+)